ncbi:MAG: two-component regulator propeller domain-containing protein [Bacillota bacterium]|nr:two-component regulator propeller domain-containing protein [Bacillota bacterium]
MKGLRKFTFPLFFLILFVLAWLLFKIKYYVPGDLGQFDQMTIEDQQEKNGFVTRFGDLNINSMVRQEDLYFIGSNDGLFIEDRKSASIQRSQGLRYVFALMETADEVLVGYDGGLASFKDGDLVLKIDAPNDQVRSFCQTEEGIWHGATDGLYLNGTKVLSKKDGLAEDMVNVIRESSDGALWLGSYAAPRGGLTIKEKDKLTIFTDLAHPDLTAIIELKPDYVLTGGGFYDKGGANLFRKKDGGWTMVQTIRKEDGLPGAKVRSFYIDQKGRLWIGSEYDGVGLYNFQIKDDFLSLDPIFIITEDHGLASGEVKFIQEDEKNYYLGTQQGLSQISKEDLEKLVHP